MKMTSYSSSLKPWLAVAISVLGVPMLQGHLARSHVHDGLNALASLLDRHFGVEGLGEFQGVFE